MKTRGTALNIGIKYCGGCNPKYDRVNLVRRLTEAVGKKAVFETAQEGREYDMLIVISGCTSSCVDYSRIKYKDAVAVISREADFAALCEVLMRKLYY